MNEPVHVTRHAIERYQERVSNIPDDAVRVILSGAMIQKASDFGAPYVRLPTGQRVVIEKAHVVTVLDRDQKIWRLDTAHDRLRQSRRIAVGGASNG